MALTVPSWVNRDPSHWNRGVLPQPLTDAPAGLVAASYGASQPVDMVWWDWMRPAAQQGQIPSCSGWSMAITNELILARQYRRDFLPPNIHIDGERAWADQRRAKYGGDMSGGLFISDAFRGAVNVGIFSPRTHLRTVAPEPHDMADALQTSPIILCSRVHKGCFELDEHGCVNEARDPDPGNEGHAWVIVGILHQGARWFASILTSWGPKYGNRGTLLMSLEEVDQGRIAPMYSIANPQRDWTGWRDVLCEVNDIGERVAA